MKTKLIFFAIAAFVAVAVNVQAKAVEEPIEDSHPNYVEVDLSESQVYLAEDIATDSIKLTEFLRQYVEDIPDGYYFSIYRINEDLMGFEHLDCAQHRTVDNSRMDGRELIIHTNAGTGQVLLITGDLYVPDMSAKGSKVQESKGSSDSKGNLVTIFVKGEEHTCIVENTSREKIYIDVNTGEEVRRESKVRNAAKCGEIHPFTANGYHYPASAIKNPELNCSKNEQGQYVLRDSVKGVYVVDFSQHVLVQNGMPQDENEMLGGEKNILEQYLDYSRDIASDTPDFANHDGMVSRLMQVGVSGLEEDYNYTFCIYKYNTDSLAQALAEYGDENFETIIGQIGTLYCKAEGQYDEEDDVIAFNLGDSVLFSMPTRANDTDGEITKTGYAYFVYANGYTYFYGLYSVRNDDYSKAITDYINITFINEPVKMQPAIDVHIGLERAQDMYKEAFGMNSFNNNNTPVIAKVNAADSDSGLPLNAVAVGTAPDGSCGQMEFGLGAINYDYDGVATGNAYLPLTEIDIMGHEFTHLAAEKLKYQNESGALDESYADIMGKKLERYTISSDAGFYFGEEYVPYVSWDLGTLISLATPMKPMRSFDNPYVTSNPACYKGLFWLDYTQTGEDEGGVHTNSTVQSHMFYLLCTGGKVTPECTWTGEEPEEVEIEAIDRDKAELIMFASLVYFGLKNLDFDAARRNSLHVAELYYGKESQEVSSLLNAWYAVGVGDWSPSADGIKEVDYTSRSQKTRKIIVGDRVIITHAGCKYDILGNKLQ